MSLEELKEKAIEAATKAYAPYSQFKVGCAIVTKTGNVYVGCNVENASYGLTVCAERNAIANAISKEGNIEIETVIIFTPTQSITTPCGACRQVISEFGNPEVYSYCNVENMNLGKIKDLLPSAFNL
ncbi:MAG: cytidine deaminase [Bacteroidota bacterium]